MPRCMIMLKKFLAVLPLLLLTYNESVSPKPLALTTPYYFTITQFGLVPYSALGSRYSPAQMLTMMLTGAAIQKKDY